MDLSEDSYNRFRLKIAYDGTNYHGWAVQENLPTVANEIEKKLSLISRYPVKLIVAGRTDKGVHATGQVAHFDIPADVKDFDDLPKLLIRINKLLPSDIRILKIESISKGFDARFSALSRTYEYLISTAPFGVLPRESNYVASWKRKLDLKLLNLASASLLGLNNFAAFCRPKPNASTIRNLQKFVWTQENDNFRAIVKADAFCWSMVRSLVGAVTGVASGARTIDWCENLLLLKQRSSDILVAPALGLSLMKVEYPEQDMYLKQSKITRKRRELDDCDCYDR